MSSDEELEARLELTTSKIMELECQRTSGSTSIGGSDAAGQTDLLGAFGAVPDDGMLSRLPSNSLLALFPGTSQLSVPPALGELAQTQMTADIASPGATQPDAGAGTSDPLLPLAHGSGSGTGAAEHEYHEGNSWEAQVEHANAIAAGVDTFAVRRRR